ncbi:MAG: UDP-N-acetylmuramate:L-alanyl-gamma-D-glutamyl-meso-diaminopimelate ligase, partial [Gammaproteobacteria bacterium]
VLGVAGTHGKTTTSAMLAWILEHNGMNPGFLIGGIPVDFGISARLGDSPFFVVEADEYDTAFFDKRSKFVHYRPRTLVLNNLEYDHADIFPDLEAIQRQFHHLVRTVPGKGLIVASDREPHIEEVLRMGCWTPVEETAVGSGFQWHAEPVREDGGEFDVYFQTEKQGRVAWSLTGEHNVRNALSAIAAARHAGVKPPHAVEALNRFHNVKRRMEIIAATGEVTVYDDFAHHPTAIKTTLDGLRKRVGRDRIVAIVEPRSNTMRMGVHSHTLAQSLGQADLALVYQPENLDWDVQELKSQAANIEIVRSVDGILERLRSEARLGGHFVFMSNGSFGGVYQRIQGELVDRI